MDFFFEFLGEPSMYQFSVIDVTDPRICVPQSVNPGIIWIFLCFAASSVTKLTFSITAYLFHYRGN